MSVKELKVYVEPQLLLYRVGVRLLALRGDTELPMGLYEFVFMLTNNMTKVPSQHLILSFLTFTSQKAIIHCLLMVFLILML